MRAFTAVAIMQAGALLLCPLSAQAQPGMAGMTEISPPLRQCIVNNAPGVELSFTSLAEGADFLVQKVCAGPAAEQVMEAARKQAEEQKKKVEEACKAAAGKKDNFTDGIRHDPSMLAMCDNPMADVFSGDDMMPYYAYSAMIMGGNGSNIPAATSLAAQTLLQLRTDKLKQKR